MVSFLDAYEVVKQIGTGATCKVKVVKEPATGVLYAAKIFNSSHSEALCLMMKNEVTALKQVNHPNIVKYIYSNEKGVYRRKQNKGNYHCMYLILELCASGNLLQVTGKFSENNSRVRFKELIEGLETLHKNGISHRDLKVENLLFDHNLKLTIADLGLSGPHLKQKAQDQLGTKGYIPPEILMNRTIYGPKADVFAAGICLFMMYARTFPFRVALPTAYHYRTFLQSPKKFWEMQEEQVGNVPFSDEFKDLIRGMLAYDPDERFTVQDIKAHPWLNSLEKLNAS